MATLNIDHTMKKHTDELALKQKLLTSAITQHEAIEAKIDSNKIEIIEKVTKWAEELTRHINDIKEIVTVETTVKTNKAKASNNDKIIELKEKLQFLKTVIQNENDTKKLQDDQLVQQLEQIQTMVMQSESKPMFTVEIPAISQINPPQLKYAEQPLLKHVHIPDSGQRQLKSAKMIKSYNCMTTETLYRGIACTESEILLTSIYTPGFIAYNKQDQEYKVFHKQTLQYGLRGTVYGPDDITVDRGNNILVTCNKHVYIYDVNKKLQKLLKNVYYGSSAYIATNSKKEIILSDSEGSMKILDYDGKQRTSWSCITGPEYFWPWYVTVNDKDEIIVTNKNPECVYILDQDGQKIHTCRPDGNLAFNQPKGLCVDDWGHIIVADTNSYSLHLVARSGDHLACLLTRDDDFKPVQVAISGPGELVAVDNVGQVNIYNYMNI